MALWWIGNAVLLLVVVPVLVALLNRVLAALERIRGGHRRHPRRRRRADRRTRRRPGDAGRHRRHRSAMSPSARSATRAPSRKLLPG